MYASESASAHGTGSNAPSAARPQDPIADLQDRISDAYYGKMGLEFMRKTQERIHWVCAGVQGERILDVGCSQGIAPILLGREGKTVLGVDSDPKAIGQAQDHLATEPEHVQARVNFVHADFLTHDFARQRFDTVVMSEVLEHLVNPQEFVAGAASVLTERGRLVVTVPFGINDFIDHKRTYYLCDIYVLLAERFEIEEVRVFGQWIGLVGTKAKARRDVSTLTFKRDLLEKAETGFHQIERELRTHWAEARQRLEEANKKYRVVTEQVASLKQKLSEEERARQIAGSEAAQLQSRIAALSAEAKQHGEARHAADKELVRAEAGAEALRTQLEASNEKFRAANELIADLKHEAAAAEASRQALAPQVEQLQRQLQAATASLDSERQKSEAELSRLRAQLAIEAQEKHAAQTQLARVEATLDGVRGQLEAANQKYRLATEHIDVLKHKIAGEAQARHAAAGQADQLRGELQKTNSSLEQEKAALAALRAQFEGADQNCRALTEQATALQQRVADEERAGRATAAALGEERAAMEALRSQLRAAEAQQSAAAEQLAALQASAAAEQAKAKHLEELLRADVQALNEQKVAAREQVEALEARLLEANRKYRASTEQYAAMKAQAQSGSVLLAKARTEHAQEIERLNRGLQSIKQELAGQQRELHRAQQARAAADAQVAKTRATLSFQLGYLLLHGFKSWEAFKRLPGQLLALRQDAKRRKQKTRGEFVPPKPSSPPVTAQAAPPASLPIVPAEDPAKALKSLRVACIMDEFTFTSYQPECNLLQLSVADWRKELEEFKPELLFIESAWRGKDEQWGSKVGHTSAEVVGIVEWCRAHRVPTVFWNKEDPVHFETFLTTAKQFDHVFTTDIDCIHRYKAALGHERVYLLPFAAQPALSNPIEKYQRKDAFCFAGAYYVKYPDRTRDLGNFVSALAQYRPVEIYDRNFGKNDPNYQFPPEYQPFIVGNLPFDQIDKAYKGYRYAINLNSIKQSQSMFARRVFELLASNTITVSNFSRGVRMLFGDLVITTDDGGEIVRRIEALAGDDVRARKFRLAGLRKVMASHTYEDRFAYVVSKVQGREIRAELPAVLVTAYAKNQEQFDAVMASFQRQSYQRRRLLVVVPGGFEPVVPPEGHDIQVVQAGATADVLLGTVADASEFVAGMVAEDYYGPNYLLDLALATRYSAAVAIGKATHYVCAADSELRLASAGHQYTVVETVPARCAIVRRATVCDLNLRDWVVSLHTRQLHAPEVLATDEFNYCKNGAGTADDQVPAAVNDLSAIEAGLHAGELLQRAERIAPAEAQDEATPVLTGRQLAGYFQAPRNKPYTFSVEGESWHASSHLPDGKHEYLYASMDLRPAELGFSGEAKFHLDASPGLNLQIVLLFLDAKKQRISHVVQAANRNHTVTLPPGTEYVRLGVRIYAGGSASIHGLVLGHRPLRPAEVIGRAEHLILTNHYPSYEDLYRNGFVHSRVAAYAKRGLKVDVFRLRAQEALSYHEFHDVDVITGSQQALHKLLAGGRYRTVAVHFLDEPMWQVLNQHLDKVNVLVWVHGAEIQPWHRREYNYENEAQREAAKVQSDERMRFWRGLLREMPERLKLVFVSRYFAEEVMEDLGFRLPPDKYEIVHNPIDTKLFAYQPKSPEQRKKILSIRPYTSRKYANDLSVRAIQALSQKPWFQELEFRMVGDGKLFDDLLAPLRGFGNVTIDRRFLTHAEIACLQREYGVFLCPTRWDSQGVSRDEAMASGLVPITTAVAATTEFVDDSCSMCASAEDWQGLADAIARVYEDPSRFQRMSKAASERVMRQTGAHVVIPRELQLITGIEWVQP